MSNIVTDQSAITEIAADRTSHDTDRAGASVSIAQHESPNGTGPNLTKLNRTRAELFAEKPSYDATTVISRALRQPPDIVHLGIEPGKLQLDCVSCGCNSDIVPAQHAEKVVERRSVEDKSVRGRMIA
jgi:hypothetical protein